MSDDLFSQNDLIIVTYGEYSSYGISSAVRALKAFTMDEVKATPGCVTHYEWDTTGQYSRISLEGMIAAGFVEELPPTREIWLGSW